MVPFGIKDQSFVEFFVKMEVLIEKFQNPCKF